MINETIATITEFYLLNVLFCFIDNIEKYLYSYGKSKTDHRKIV